MSDEYPDWFGKRKQDHFFKGWFFKDMNVERLFRKMEKMMEEEIEAFTSNVPKDFIRERKLPDGRRVREWGPFLYGYSIKISPDGKPEICEFGNVKHGRFGPQVTEKRDPLVDIIETDGEVQIVAELPGVDKHDIKLHGTEDKMMISVNAPRRKYFKEVELPAKVNLKKTKAKYKNGVLEIKTLKTTEERRPKGEPINIE